MIENYIGKPFVDGGRGPDSFDCWGLVKHIYLWEYDIAIQDYFISALDTQKVSKKMMEQKDLFWKRREDGEKNDGDLIAISMDMAYPRNYINHVGVYLGYERFIHTRKKTGAVIERTDDFKWSNRIEGYYYYNG